MKFVDGLMIHSGDPVNDYVDSACRHVLLRQGVLGIKVIKWKQTIRISSSQKHRQVQLGLSVVSRRRATSFWVWSMPNMTFTSIRSSHFVLILYTSLEFTTTSLTHTCLTGQDHVAVRPHRQDWTQEASARQRVDRGAQGGDPAAQPLLRDQGCQARPGPRSCCLNSCLDTLISHNHVLSVKH